MFDLRFVAFLDDDDEWLPEKMAFQIAKLEENSSISCVSCGRFIIEGDHQYLETYDESTVRALYRHIGITASFSFLVFRTSVLRQDIRIDEALSASQDWDLVMRASTHGPIGFVKQPLVRYYVHPGPRISNSSIKRLGGYKRWLENHGPCLPHRTVRWHRGRLRIAEAHQGHVLARIWAGFTGVIMCLMSDCPGIWRFKRPAIDIADYLLPAGTISWLHKQTRKAS